jgi:branched-chain amino acid transport system substrate-binding protein
MFRALIAVALVLVAAAIALSGCGTTNDTSSTAATTPSTTATSATTSSTEGATGSTESTTSTTAAPKADLALPELTILTGPGAQFGLDAQWGAQYAVDEINATGGVDGHVVKMTSLDTAMDPAKAVTEMAKALDMDSLAIIGPMDQISTGAAGQDAVKAGVPFFGSFNSPEDLAAYNGWGLSLYPYVTDLFGVGIDLWLDKNPDLKSVVIFTIPSDPAIAGATATAEAKFAERGVKVVGKVEVTPGQLDMSSPAVKAIGTKADGYYSAITAEEHARLTAELRKRGVSEGRRIAAGVGADSATLYEVGGDALEDTFVWNIVNMYSTDERWKKFVEAYKEDHDGALPYSPAILGQYNAVYAFKTAVEQLKLTGDPAKLADERLQIKNFLFNAKGIEGGQGPFDYVDGGVSMPAYLFQVKGGAPTLVQ